jgi:non-heme chloroperoxidase
MVSRDDRRLHRDHPRARAGRARGRHPEVFAGRGLCAASVAIDPALYRGVLPLPISLKSGFPVLGNPANINRAVPLTYDQLRYAFANAVGEEEARQLDDEFAVPAAGKPLFQAAAANLNPWTEAKVDHANPDRGPLLILSGEKDHTIPWAIADAEYRRQAHSPGVTEIAEMKAVATRSRSTAAGARSATPR